METEIFTLLIRNYYNIMISVEEKAAVPKRDEHVVT